MSLSNFVATTIGAIWFFSKEKSRMGLPMFTGFYWGLTWNMGSLVLGSVVIHLGWFIYLVIGSIYHSVKEKAESQEQSPFKGCFKLIVRFYEFCLSYAHPQSIIEIVLKSSNFCTASKAAAEQTKKSHKLDPRYIGLTDIILVFGVLTISILTTLIAKFLMSTLEFFSSSVLESSIPLVLSFMLSFVVAIFFIHLPLASVEAVAYCEQISEEPLLGTNKID